MERTMTKSEKELQDRINRLQKEQAVKDLESTLNRARSVTVGTCFGGTTELTMRGQGSYLWCPMQPVEVIELIHQLAANVGCHIHVQPRKDFSSWRDWKYTEQELEHFRGEQSVPGVGFAPHANDITPHQNKGQVLPPVEQQPGLKIETPIRSPENVMATKKTVNRRSAKRAAKAS
jgi:hypothetical protein